MQVETLVGRAPLLLETFTREAQAKIKEIQESWSGLPKAWVFDPLNPEDFLKYLHLCGTSYATSYYIPVGTTSAVQKGEGGTTFFTFATSEMPFIDEYSWFGMILRKSPEYGCKEVYLEPVQENDITIGWWAEFIH